MIWETAKLGDLCEVYGGSTPLTSKTEYWNGRIVWLSPTDLPAVGEISNINESARKVSEKGVEAASLTILPKGTVVYSTRATIGKIGIAVTPLTTNQGFANFICNGRLDNKYLCYALKYFTPQIAQLSNSTTFSEVSRTSIRNFSIPVPPLLIQQEIVAILDKADELRRKDKTLIAQYDALLQSIFYHMFGDPVKKEKRFEMNKAMLSEIADIVSGVAKNGNTFKEDFIEVPYMRVANVQDAHIVLDEIKTIKVSQKDFNKYLLKKDDILLTEGGDPDKLGRGAVWHNEIAPCIHQNHIFRVRVRNIQEINPIYLSYHIGSSYGKSYFLKAAKQTTGIASINLTQLKGFKVVVPPVSLQNKFSDITKDIGAQKQKVKQQIQQSESLFKSLLQKAFKGELVR